MGEVGHVENELIRDKCLKKKEINLSAMKKKLECFVKFIYMERYY